MTTLWDARLFARSAAAAAFAFLVTWLVTAATDEGGVAWAERAARAAPLAPACAAAGVWLVLAPVRSRGEALALAALGQSPARTAAGAVLGSACLAVSAAMLLGTCRRVNVAGFFPAATRATAWVWQRGEFVEPIRGLRVNADGAPSAFPGGAASSLGAVPAFGRLAAALSTAAAGIALPLLVAHAALSRPSDPSRSAMDRRRWRRSVATVLLLAVIALAATIFIFQAAAARRVPAAAGTLPPIALLAFAVRWCRAR
ncbi:MAG: hypothetical protein M3O50_11235 [Myxococcota bacterium]|nr:hypothetical protein [Myxococcota bacterium]